MSAKKQKTPIGLLLGFIGRVFCVAMMFLTAWTLIVLLKGLYFPKRVATIIEEGKKHESELDEKMANISESKDFRAHFHNIDASIFMEEKDPPLCLTCHGNMPHTKALEMRAMLNMHTYFVACEVCHVRKQAGDEVYYAWLDFETKEKIFTLNGKPGDFGAKIVPIRKLPDGTEQRIDKPLNEGFAKEFIEEGSKWTLEKRARAKAIIHEEHTKQPVLCNECHTSKNQYLPFEDLHYTKKRADQLAGTEAAGMVMRYIKFYLPTMFDPVLDAKRQQLQEKMKAAEDPDVFKSQ